MDKDCGRCDEKGHSAKSRATSRSTSRANRTTKYTRRMSVVQCSTVSWSEPKSSCEIQIDSSKSTPFQFDALLDPGSTRINSKFEEAEGVRFGESSTRGSRSATSWRSANLAVSRARSFLRFQVFRIHLSMMKAKRTIRTNIGSQFRGPDKDFCHAKTVVKDTENMPMKTDYNRAGFVKTFLERKKASKADFPSPAHLMFRRVQRSKLPVLRDIPSEDSAPEPGFKDNDRVWIQDPKTKLWDTGGIVWNSRKMKISFLQRHFKTRTVFRNQRFLLKAKCKDSVKSL